jgi:pimeloyl-ACP methyl ester carboxylesterase
VVRGIRLRPFCVHAVGVAALATGCASWLPAPTPMRTLSSRAYPDKQARCLLVLLPGLGDADRDFADHGFIAAIRQRKLSIDVISANATLGYYARQTLLTRLETDVFASARKSGYEEIWVGGVSLGGMGALLVAQRYASELTGVILMAPYLGGDDLLDEIGAAGGLTRWQPPASIAKDDYPRETWRWLKGATAQPDAPPWIYLAAGDRDKLRKGQRLLAAALPSERVFSTSGKHDWKPWSVLWADVLDHSDLGMHCREP